MILDLTQSPLAKSLARVGEAIVDLLDVAAAATPGTGWKTVAASWSCGRSPRQESIEAILELPPEERVELRDAVAADLRFDSAFEGGSFEFRFASLSPAARDAGRKLLLWAYETFADSGFDLGDGQATDRAAWEDAFRAINPEVQVCPACLDAKLEERVHGRAAVDLDHFLPKSLYPPLAVHGANLVPICKVCNGPAKWSADPLRDGEEVLLPSEIWFPYARAGIDELELSFSVGNPTGSLDFAGTPEARRRAKLHDQLFDLGTRWEASLKAVHENICDDLLERGVPAEEGALRQELETIARIEEKAIKRSSQAFLTSRYCRWLLANQPAFDDFLRNMTR